MDAAVVVFPGSNRENDVATALEHAMGGRPQMVWHRDSTLPKVDLIVVPGGFSYGDYLRCGAIAAHSPVMREIKERAKAGVAVLGICNGFQILTEARMLPGTLRPNKSLSFVCRDVPLIVTRTDSPFTARCARARRLTVPVKHGDGCWFAPADETRALEQAGQLLLRYEQGSNPNGAVADVAGVCNATGNVFGLMPHPEHAVDPRLGSTDGALILGSLVDAARLSIRVPV